MGALIFVVALTSLQARSSLEMTPSRLHAYLLDYEPRLSKLMADEAMTQTHLRPAQTFGGQPTWRQLTSEIAFVRLPGEGPWLGYRHVTTVDGKSVTESPDRLQTLLAQGGDEANRAFEMAKQSARFNLGQPRTTNVPTLPLEVLHPRHRNRLKFELHVRNASTDADCVACRLKKSRVQPLSESRTATISSVTVPSGSKNRQAVSLRSKCGRLPRRSESERLRKQSSASLSRNIPQWVY